MDGIEATRRIVESGGPSRIPALHYRGNTSQDQLNAREVEISANGEQRERTRTGPSDRLQTALTPYSAEPPPPLIKGQRVRKE
nr:hypothetical protein [Streptomyces sp. S1D4-11]